MERMIENQIKSLTRFKEAPPPIGERVDVRVGIRVQELWEPQKVGVHGSQIKDLPVIILEITVRRRGHGTSHVTGDKEHIGRRVEDANFGAREHLWASDEKE